MDTTPPTELVLDKPRRGTPAARPALLYFGIVVIAIVLCAFIYGIKSRLFNGHPLSAAAKPEAPLAPAASNREAIERKTQDTSKKVAIPNPEQSPKSGVSVPTTQSTDGPVIAWQPPPLGHQIQSVSTQQQLDPEEDLEKKARESATTVKFESVSVSKTVDPMFPATPQPSSGTADESIQRLIRAASPLVGKSEEPSQLEQKEQFAKSESSPLQIERQSAQSRFSVSRGTRIQAVLTSNANSQLPGQIQAMVRQDVFNSLCGQPGQGCYVEIPRGSMLLGKYNSEVSYGQNRMQIAWDTLVFPDQSTVDLGKMAAYSADGTAGLHDQTDQHWKRIIAGALLTSGISAGVSLSQSRNSAPLSYPSAGQVASASLGQGLGEVGNQITSKNVNIPPYNKLRIGLPLIVDINRPMIFDGPYNPLEPAR